jgi:hypothetical protein
VVACAEPVALGAVDDPHVVFDGVVLAGRRRASPICHRPASEMGRACQVAAWSEVVVVRWSWRWWWGRAAGAGATTTVTLISVMKEGSLFSVAK